MLSHRACGCSSPRPCCLRTLPLDGAKVFEDAASRLRRFINATLCVSTQSAMLLVNARACAHV